MFFVCTCVITHCIGWEMKQPRAAIVLSSDSDSEGPQQKDSSSCAKSGAATYLSSLRSRGARNGKGTTVYQLWCDVCRAERSCGHQGRRDVERHMLSRGYLEKVRAVR